MTDREHLLKHLNRRAAALFKERHQALDQYLYTFIEMQSILRTTKTIEITTDEMDAELHAFFENTQAQPTTDESLIHRAIEVIQEAHNRSKSEGREIASLFIRIFNRISPKLGTRFTEIFELEPAPSADKVTLDHYQTDPVKQYDAFLTYLAQLQIIKDAAGFSSVMEVAKRLGFDIDEVHVGERESDIMTSPTSVWDERGDLVVYGGEPEE